MQETEFVNPAGEAKRLQEFFSGQDEKEVEKKMQGKLEELEAEGHTLTRRAKIGRNDMCPCESGKKFKKCCIDKVHDD